MEPIRLWRWKDRMGVTGATTWHDSPLVDGMAEYAALPRADFDALAAEASDARTLRAERDALVKERDALKIEVKAADCAGRFMEGMRNAATARADKAEAALKDALARIDALREGKA